MALALWPADAAAQRRIVRRGPATRVAVGVGFGYGYPLYSYPFFYDPFWWGFYDYQFRRYPPYGYGYYDASADLRIQVTPRQAEVYIDGYLTGTVDDFDGVFQRLHVPLGEHEITVYAPGYRTFSQKMLFRPFESYQIKETLQPLASGDPDQPRPVPVERPEPQGPPPRGGAPMPRPGDRSPDRDLARGDRFGTLSVRVQPADAEIVIDGERWEAPGGERILVELAEGTHRVEVRKAGHRTYNSTVRIRSGETVTLNVSLPQGE